MLHSPPPPPRPTHTHTPYKVQQAFRTLEAVREGRDADLRKANQEVRGTGSLNTRAHTRARVRAHTHVRAHTPID